MYRYIRSLNFEQLIGIFLVIIGFLTVILTQPIELNDGVGIGLMGIGLGFCVWGMHQMNERKIEGRLNSILERIEKIGEEIQKEINEQASSSSPLVTSLHALSQYYLDYIAKQKGEGEKD